MCTRCKHSRPRKSCSANADTSARKKIPVRDLNMSKKVISYHGYTNHTYGGKPGVFVSLAKYDTKCAKYFCQTELGGTKTYIRCRCMSMSRQHGN